MTQAEVAWPRTSSGVTPEWLSAALSERHPGTVVTEATVPGIVQGSAVKAHIELTYAAGASNGLPTSMYLKGGLGGPMAAVAGDAYLNEARFFAELADDVPVDKPQHFFAGVTPDGQDGLVLLEVLSRRATFGRAASGPFDLDVVVKIVEMQASYHAAFWEHADLQARTWMQPDKTHLRQLMLSFILSQENWDKHLALRSEVVPEAVRDRESVIGAIKRMWSLNDSEPRTLIHGDPHQDNYFITHEGMPALLDWQTVQSGPWAHDVTYSIIGCLSIDDRRHNLEALIRHYLDTLKHCGVKDCPSFEDALLAVRRNVWHSFCWWLTPVEMQPDETARIVGERFTVAAVDLDSFDAVS